MKVAFWVDGKPIVQGNHRISPAGYVYEPNGARLDAWRYAILLKARETGAVYYGPVAVSLSFGLPVPKRALTPTGELREDVSEHHAKKPDLDKLVRAVFDALAKSGIIEDDSKICRLITHKVNVTPDNCGVGVVIEGLDRWELKQ